MTFKQIKKILVYSAGTCCLLILAYGLLRPTIIYYDLKKNGRYTICYTEKVTYSKAGKWIDYKYFVNKKEYSGSDFYFYGLLYPNGRYYVSFSGKRPDWCKFQYIQVSSKIKTAPPEGWEKLPE